MSISGTAGRIIREPQTGAGESFVVGVHASTKTPADFADEAAGFLERRKAELPFELFAAVDTLKVSKMAPDWATKGFHLHFNGIEIAVRPGQNATIVLRPVFSSQERIAGPAIRTVEGMIANNPATRRQLYEQAVRARDYLRGEGLARLPDGTPTTFARQASEKAGELTFLIKALQRMGLK